MIHDTHGSGQIEPLTFSTLASLQPALVTLESRARANRLREGIDADYWRSWEFIKRGLCDVVGWDASPDLPAVLRSETAYAVALTHLHNEFEQAPKRRGR